MQLKTILNRIEPFKSFVYGKVRWVEKTERPTIEVEVHARKNGRPICSGCGQPGPGYDRLPQRRFEFVPLWGMAVHFVYEPVLKHSRWCLLKRRENLTEKQTVKLAELLKYNLKSVGSYLLREDFQRFWEYTSPGWAGRFLDQWCTRTLRSRIKPMKKIVHSLRAHRSLILNWFHARGTVSSGTVEGLNNKCKLTMRKAYGFRMYETIKIALFHTLGDLPKPEFTHEFC